MDIYFPFRSVRIHIQDKPWVTGKLKYYISKRQQAFTRFGKDSIIYKFWRKKVHSIKYAKRHYYSHKVEDLAHSNPAKWWKQIKQLTGQASDQGEWFHRFIGPDQPDQFQDCLALANGINDFFFSITEQFTPLVQSPVRHTIVPPSLLVSEFEVLRDLNNLASNKPPGPDGISNQIFKVFAPELAPVSCAIYNQSLQDSFVPGSLKQSIVTPVPKIFPPQEID